MLRKFLAVLAYGTSLVLGLWVGVWLIAKPGFLDVTALLNTGPNDWSQALWGAVRCICGVVAFFLFVGMAIEFHDIIAWNRRLPWKKEARQLLQKYRWLQKSQ
jgi:hypothetical protein